MMRPWNDPVSTEAYSDPRAEFRQPVHGD